MKGKAGVKGGWGKGNKGWGKGKGLGVFGEWDHGGWEPSGYQPYGLMYSVQQQASQAAATPAVGASPESQAWNQNWMRRLASFTPKESPTNPIDPNIEIPNPLAKPRMSEDGYNEAILWTMVGSDKGQKPRPVVHDTAIRNQISKGYWGEAFGEESHEDDQEIAKEEGIGGERLIVHIKKKEDKSACKQKKNKTKTKKARFDCSHGTKARSILPAGEGKRVQEKLTTAKEETARESLRDESEDGNILTFGEDTVCGRGLIDAWTKNEARNRLDRNRRSETVEAGNRLDRNRRSVNEFPSLRNSERDRKRSAARLRIKANFQRCCNDAECEDSKLLPLPEDIPLLAQNGSIHDPKAARFVPEVEEEYDLTGMPSLEGTDDDDKEEMQQEKDEKEAEGKTKAEAKKKAAKTRKGSIRKEFKKFMKSLSMKYCKKDCCDPAPDETLIVPLQSSGMVEASGGCSAISTGNLLNPFWEKETTALNGMSPAQWTLIEVIVDSGACETVLPASLCNHIMLRESAASKAKVEYEVASGKAVPNLGEKHCEIYVEGTANPMIMHFQVADIHRPLLSLSRCADQGFRSHLDDYGGWLEDKKTGEVIPITRRGNLYIMQMWIRGAPDEVSPSSPFVGRG